MGAEVRARIFVELTDVGVEIPLRVERVSEPPSLVPGGDLLVTGIIECVFEDSAGVDTVCYLEAHGFGGLIPEPDSVWVLLKQFRRKGHISRNKGTVAYLVAAGREFYGVNASLDDDLTFVDEDSERGRREFWHERLEPEFDYGRRDARYLIHAEAHALMRAFRALGYLPPEVTVFVDRETCKWCVGGLGGLMEAVGVRRLTIVQQGEEEPLVLEVESSAPR